MIASTLQSLEQLYKIQNDYRPSNIIRQQLADKELTMVVGAAGEGKSTVLAKVVTLDERFAVAGSFTTRDPRPDDPVNNYKYYPNTEEGITQLFSLIGHREAVQFAVHPASKHLYGSTLENYPKQYNVRDTMAATVAGFRQYGFKATHTVTIITEPAAWLERFTARFPLGHPQRAGRRDEAIVSFKWSLAQIGDSHTFIENVAGKPEIAAQIIIDYTFGKPYDGASARQLCEVSLAVARLIEA